MQTAFIHNRVPVLHHGSVIYDVSDVNKIIISLKTGCAYEFIKHSDWFQLEQKPLDVTRSTKQRCAQVSK